MKMLIFCNFTLIVFVLSIKEIENALFIDDPDIIKLSESPTFVDKSLLLKHIFNGGKRKLITAPRKFGKSTNLNMIEQFLSINLDEREQRNIKKIFNQFEIYKVKRHFVNRHFGKYPVLFVDFKNEGHISNYNEALATYKFSIHNAFNKHKYLRNSTELDEDDKMLFDMWCGSYSFDQINESRVRSGLSQLLGMLQTHFNKHVVVLIDEYDSVIDSATFTAERRLDLQKIVGLTSAILSSLLNGNNLIELALVTGISCISNCGLSEINNIQRYRFLEDHAFVDFFGFTNKEVAGLFNKPIFNLNPQEITKAYQLYNGYKSKSGQVIYNTFAILKVLRKDKACNYWDTSDYNTHFSNMLKIPEVEHNIAALLDGASINITFYDKFTIQHLLNLRNMYLQNQDNVRPNSDLVFSRFLELGYLTYDIKSKSGGDVECVKLPNKEIWERIFKEFKEHYIITFNLSRDIAKHANYPVFKNISKECSKRLRKNTMAAFNIWTAGVKCLNMLGPLWRTIKNFLPILK